MALECMGLVPDMTFIAENDLSAAQYHWVELSGTFQVDTTDAATDKLFGILQNKPNIGEMAQVRRAGVSKILAGSGDLSVGEAVACDGDGKGVAASTGDGYCGTCTVAATNGNIGSVDIDFGYGLES